MDGLLINTEDLYLSCITTILRKYNRPAIPTSMIPKLMGVPSSSAADTVYAWAKLPISREEFDKEQAEGLHLLYPDCEPLPGVPKLLRDLNGARNSKGEKIHLALASSSTRPLFELKTQHPEIRALFNNFEANNIILGDNPGLKLGRGKPAPDIFLLAPAAINRNLGDGDEIVGEQCVVFEDSVAGVQAARRAGMRVVWVPNALLVAACAGKEEEILAGRSDGGELDGNMGNVGNGRGEQFPSLENFPYAKYGIEVLGTEG